MKKVLGNSLIILLLFFCTVIGLFFAILIRDGALDLPIGLGTLLAFLFLFGLTSYGLLKFNNQISLYGVLIPILLGVLLVILPKAYFSTLTFSIKVSPFYISILLGIMSGYLYCTKKIQKLKFPLVLSLFPLLMSFGIYDLWIHKIEFGNWTGEVTAQTFVSFELLTKNGDLVTNESLGG